MSAAAAAEVDSAAAGDAHDVDSGWVPIPSTQEPEPAEPGRTSNTELKPATEYRHFEEMRALLGGSTETAVRLVATRASFLRQDFRWMDASEAPRCARECGSADFGALWRQHHCRSCGDIVCGHCLADKKMWMDRWFSKAGGGVPGYLLSSSYTLLNMHA